MKYTLHIDSSYHDINEVYPKARSLIIVNYVTDDGINYIHEIVRYINTDSLRNQMRLSGGHLYWKYHK